MKLAKPLGHSIFVGFLCGTLPTEALVRKARESIVYVSMGVRSEKTRVEPARDLLSIVEGCVVRSNLEVFLATNKASSEVSVNCFISLTNLINE